MLKFYLWMKSIHFTILRQYYKEYSYSLHYLCNKFCWRMLSWSWTIDFVWRRVSELSISREVGSHSSIHIFYTKLKNCLLDWLCKKELNEMVYAGIFGNGKLENVISEDLNWCWCWIGLEFKWNEYILKREPACSMPNNDP